KPTKTHRFDGFTRQNKFEKVYSTNIDQMKPVVLAIGEDMLDSSPEESLVVLTLDYKDYILNFGPPGEELERVCKFYLLAITSLHQKGDTLTFKTAKNYTTLKFTKEGTNEPDQHAATNFANHIKTTYQAARDD
ncbi:unnamed protein product, partial [Meganyctiphanes norvegica]